MSLIEGASVKIGAKEYIVPALNFKQLRTLMPKIKNMALVGSQLEDEQMADIIDVVHAALSRNYPEMSKEFLEDSIDLANVRSLISAIMGQSGLVSAPGETAAGSL